VLLQVVRSLDVPPPAKPSAKHLLQLAEQIIASRGEANRAGRVLHDKVGPLLMGAGLRLQLLGMDQPETTQAVGEVLSALDQAMVEVRQVSQGLAPSPVFRLGFEKAVQKLVEDLQRGFSGEFRLKFTAKGKPGLDVTVPLYDVIAAVLEDAIKRRGSTKLVISISGVKRLSARIQHNGRKSANATHSAIRILAEASGMEYSLLTGGSTIVLIRHGISRPSRG
jgi:signal transduction histidine kinase